MKNHKLTQRVALLICLLLTSGLTFSQSRRVGNVPLRVLALQNSGTAFEAINLFNKASVQKDEMVEKALHDYMLLDVNRTSRSGLLSQQPSYIRVSVPTSHGEIVLMLYRENISPNGFTLMTNKNEIYDHLNSIVHYRGMVESDPNSVVSLSVSNEETIAMISNDQGNYVIGELAGSVRETHIVYNDKDLLVPFSYDCGTNTSGIYKPAEESILRLPPPAPGTMSTKCVNWYYETDYDIFVGKGSLANVNSYIQGAFNNVATLYANDGISVTLQTLYVWTTVDPYVGPSTTDYLSQFGTNRTSFQGNMATLVGYSGGGGVAFVNTLCSSNNSSKMGYCGINSTYQTVPTYSWTVEVLTHEDGHLLGSKHTHDCAWNGNSTRIDGCGPQAGYAGSGTCAAGPIPTSGTIMSYCHLISGVGINFNYGFGPQPAALILDKVNNAACLTNCAPCSPPAKPGEIIGATTLCNTSSQTYTVSQVSGATGYIWTLPSGWTGTSTTNTITIAPSGAGMLMVAAVNACGSSALCSLVVDYKSIPAMPSVISGSAAVCSGTSQAYSVSYNANASTYIWSLPSGWSGTSTTRFLTSTSGLSGGTITVSAVNVCGTGPARTLSVASASVAPLQPDAIAGPTGVCSGSSFTYNIPAVSNAASYTWTLPSGWSGTSTSNTINVVCGTAAGDVQVVAANGCGVSPSRILSTNIAVAPAQPGVIAMTSGTNYVCPGDIRNYSISAVSGATSYTWIMPSGITITSGQGTNSVSILVGSSFAASDSVRVTADNGCAKSAVRSKAIFKNNPARPSVISGVINNICGSTAAPYSVTPVSGITYNWSTASTGPVILSGQGTASITMDFSVAPITNTLSVTASNACGVSTARTLAITLAPPQPGIISGTAVPCANAAGVPYSITPVSGASSYTWTVPTGSRINDGTVLSAVASLTTASNSVTVNFKTTAGNVSVKANNACGSGVSRTLAVTFPCREGAINLSETDALLIQPNIVTDQVKFQVKSSANTSLTLAIRDINGKIISLTYDELMQGNNESGMDVSNIPSGIYSVQAEFNGMIRTARFIKL